MAQPPRSGHTNGIQAQENQIRSRLTNSPSASNTPPQPQDQFQLQEHLEELAPLPPPLPQGRSAVAQIFKYAVSGIIVISAFALCVRIQREFYMNQLLKYSPSPSPFQNAKQEPVVEKFADKEPGPELVPMKYEPPSEALQKVPFLRKSEDQIYADQMKHVLVTLKRAVSRMDRGMNDTLLAGVITMRPNDKQVNEVNLDGLDDEEGIGEVSKEEVPHELPTDTTKVVKDLVNRLTSALTELRSSLKPEVPKPTEREPDPSAEDVVGEILVYRSKYYTRDRELAKMIAGDNVTRDPKFAHEADKREQLRRQLIIKLIDQFFATETDDDARIEKAYHYAMSESDKQERYARLEVEIFGPTDLVSGGPDAIYGDYRRKMGYVYDEHLNTFIKSSEIQKLKSMDSRERKAFYAEMKILLKLEMRIKGKVVKQAEEKRSEL